MTTGANNENDATETEIICTLCKNDILINLLEKFNVECPVHEEVTTDPFDSFIKSFAKVLNVTVESIMETIDSRRNSEHFTSLQTREYGHNFERVFRNPRKVANLAWIAALAEEYRREIIIICDLFCLNFAHQGQQVIIFRPSRNFRNNDPVGCVLFGINTYHPLISSENLANLRENRNFCSVRFNTVQEAGVDNTALDSEEGIRDTDFVEQMNENASVDLGTIAEDTFDSEERISDDQNISVTFQEFLNRFFSNSSADDITSEGHMSELKLNFTGSSMDPNNINFKKTYDIDGFFSLIEMRNFPDILKCSAKFLLYPSLVDTRTRKNLKILYGQETENPLKSVKIGVIELPIGTIDMILVINTNRRISDELFLEIAENAANFARNLRCREDSEHYPEHCPSKDISRNHSSTRSSSFKKRGKQELESYTARLAYCYSYHFHKYLKAKLGNGHRGNEHIFLKCIGCKSTNFTENFSESFENLNEFKMALDFDKLDMSKVWIDFCVTTSGESETDQTCLFWRGKKLADEIGVAGQLYPNLFAVEISDLHSYKKNGKLIKTNCYSSYCDLISGKANKPVVFQNYSKKLIKTISEVDGLRGIYSKIDDIKSSMNNTFDDLMYQIECAEWDSGSVRAEFRVTLSDYYSIIPMLDEIFSIENIKRWTLCFRTIDINRLAKYYLNSLKKLMINNLLQILRGINETPLNSHFIMENIASISSLESLLTATLFSGLTYSFVSELVWNRAIDNRNSLELSKILKSHNRLVFKPEFFDQGSFKLTASGEVLDFIFQKLHRNSVFIFPPIDLILSFFSSESLEEMAILLWKIYFSELNSNAFLNNGQPRWKLAALNRNVITAFSQEQLSLIGAIAAIFNFDKYQRFTSWKNRYYLKLAKSMLDRRKEIKIKDFHMLMKTAMERLQIDHVHYAGNDNYNGCPSRHNKINWEGHREQQRRNRDEVVFSDNDLKIIARFKSNNSRVIPWLEHDIGILVKGVNEYTENSASGNVKINFNAISLDKSLKFFSRRNAACLRSKWNALVQQRTVYQDSDRRWIFPELPLNSNRRSNIFVLPQSFTLAAATASPAQQQLQPSSDESHESGSSFDYDYFPSDYSYDGRREENVSGRESEEEVTTPVASAIPRTPIPPDVSASIPRSQIPPAIISIPTLPSLHTPAPAVPAVPLVVQDYIPFDAAASVPVVPSTVGLVLQTSGITNDEIPAPRPNQQNGIYRQRQNRSTRIDMANQLGNNPTLRIIFDVMSRHFSSANTSYSLSTKLYNLGPTGSITLSALVNTAPFNSRIDKLTQARLIEDLSATNIFIISNPKPNVTQIRKAVFN